MISKKKIIVIGSGFASLSAAALLGLAGHEVTILEKNDQAGGRARTWEQDGFVFDMGPSWYWMPEVFDDYYRLFGKKTSDFYELKRLDPGYRIYYHGDEKITVPASVNTLIELFEQKEKGSGEKLRSFISDAKYKYETAMSEYVFRISDSVMEYMDLSLLIKSFQLKLFQSLRSEVRSKFSTPSLVSLLEFPVLFLGSTPGQTPAMYSMMNYADLVLGTWYPMGGMHKIVEAIKRLATENGVKIMLNQEVTKIEVEQKRARHVVTKGQVYEADVVIAGSDYHHTEQVLLDSIYRSYTEEYWDSRKMSPSSLLFYVGIDKKLQGLLHHNLFFDANFEEHARDIYEQPRWPADPLFYVCVTSVTDPSTAPEGMENLFLLMPLAPGIEDTEEKREEYFDRMIDRIEQKIGILLKENIVVKRSYCISDFEKDYYSYKGNAYGLANTIMQTAILKPKMISPKVKNLFYIGQLTVPGPGVPPAIISGQIVAKEVNRQISQKLI